MSVPESNLNYFPPIPSSQIFPSVIKCRSSVSSLVISLCVEILQSPFTHKKISALKEKKTSFVHFTKLKNITLFWKNEVSAIWAKNKNNNFPFATFKAKNSLKAG